MSFRKAMHVRREMRYWGRFECVKCLSNQSNLKRLKENSCDEQKKLKKNIEIAELYVACQALHGHSAAIIERLSTDNIWLYSNMGFQWSPRLIYTPLRFFFGDSFQIIFEFFHFPFHSCVDSSFETIFFAPCVDVIRWWRLIFDFVVASQKWITPVKVDFFFWLVVYYPWCINYFSFERFNWILSFLCWNSIFVDYLTVLFYKS